MVTSNSGNLSGYRSVQSAPQYDKKAGGWVVRTTGFKQETDEDRQNQYLQDLESQYKLQTKANDLKNRYGVDDSGSVSRNFSSNSSSNFGSGSGSGFGLTGNYSLDDMTERAKDMARFRLGLDQEQAKFSRGLREEESQSDFGRKLKEIDTTFAGQERLSNITQNAQTGRLEKELANRIQQQDKTIGQQNLMTTRAIGLASRRLGG